LDIPERGNAASLTEKLDCVTALWPRGGSWGKHGVGDSKAPGSVAAAQQHRLLILVTAQHSGGNRGGYDDAKLRFVGV
jgi:hypothetical protein